MLRRNFLKALALAAVAPALVVHTDPVAAAVVNPHQKFIDALVLYDNTIAAKTSKDLAIETQEMDKLFAFLMTNFVKPTPGDVVFQQQVKELLETKTEESLDTRLRYVPPQVAEMMWPVAVAKALLSEHKVRCHVKHMPAFGEFIEHYKWFIIA